MKDLQTIEKNEILSENELISFLDGLGMGKNLDDKQKKLFIGISQAYGLNPFKREVHPVAYKDYQTGNYVLSVVTGYEVYIKRAERSGKLDGWKSGTKKEGNDIIGWVEIKRKDWTEPFYHEVYFDEVKGTKKDGSLTAFWQKAPRFQLKKVAISQGFRLCFPDELGGIPYTADELPDNMAGRNERDVTEIRTLTSDELKIIDDIVKLANDNAEIVGEAAIEFNTKNNLEDYLLSHTEAKAGNILDRLRNHIDNAKDGIDDATDKAQIDVQADIEV